MESGQNTGKDKRMYELGLRFKGCTTESFGCSWMETGGQSDILGYVGFNLDKPWSITVLESVQDFTNTTLRVNPWQFCLH